MIPIKYLIKDGEATGLEKEGKDLCSKYNMTGAIIFLIDDENNIKSGVINIDFNSVISLLNFGIYYAIEKELDKTND
jgi:hypothetical protein